MATGGNRGFDGVSEWEPVEAEHRRKLARTINRINGGKMNCTVGLTLQANQATTTIVDPRIGGSSILLWMPQTANASLAARAGIFVTGRTKGAAILNHAVSAALDQTFTIAILG